MKLEKCEGNVSFTKFTNLQKYYWNLVNLGETQSGLSDILSVGYLLEQ